jgi:hypothetical protein
MIQTAEFKGEWILERFAKVNSEVHELDYWNGSQWVPQPAMARQFETEADAQQAAAKLASD